MFKFTTVDYSCEGEGPMGFYDSEGNKLFSGDPYNDNIHEYIEGYIDGLKYAGHSLEISTITWSEKPDYKWWEDDLSDAFDTLEGLEEWLESKKDKIQITRRLTTHS